jgi:hypothetical protein
MIDQQRNRAAQGDQAIPKRQGDGALAYHKYKVGQTVHFAGGLKYATNVRGLYKIVRLLPSETDDRQYRIQSITDAHERVVRESEIQAA